MGVAWSLLALVTVGTARGSGREQGDVGLRDAGSRALMRLALEVTAAG